MDISSLSSIIHLRILVGYLGEQSQHNWWPSNFFSESSSIFLDPIFPRTANLARYSGVIEAAKLLHDKHIGVGRVFHLFRLPEVMEQSLFEHMQESGIPESLTSTITTQDNAMGELRKLATGSVELREGPIQIGNITELNDNDWLGLAAAYYFAAFNSDLHSFPYMVEAT